MLTNGADPASRKHRQPSLQNPKSIGKNQAHSSTRFQIRRRLNWEKDIDDRDV